MTIIPQLSWFKMKPPSDLHGLGHTGRVMAWAWVLTQEMEWREPVVWAAACHDLRRRDDGSDPEHGFRAGTWVRRKLPGLLGQLPPQLDLIAEACYWHATPDRVAGWDHPVLWYLKDADGLDRARLYDLDIAYLRHPESLTWVDRATLLYERTLSTEDPLVIWQKAAQLGLPVEGLLELAARQGELLSSGERPA